MDTRCDVELRISNQYLHHHASSVLNEHITLEDLLRDSIEGEHRLEVQIRQQRGREYLGVNAKSLNRALRKSFSRTGKWRYEATVRDGFISDSPGVEARVEGFDIARYDERANLAAVWSACFGRRPLRNGADLWAVASSGVGQELAEDVARRGTEGQDLVLDRMKPTILGEIQFGNWALAYRDVMKLLAATTEVEVDLFVYVVADGSLADMISSGTVNYEKFCAILRDFSSVVNVPTWVIGFDFANGTTPTLEDLTSPKVQPN